MQAAPNGRVLYEYQGPPPQQSDRGGEKAWRGATKLEAATDACDVTNAQPLFPCGLTLELTGMQWHCAARRMLACTPCGAMPLRVRVERPVMSHSVAPVGASRSNADLDWHGPHLRPNASRTAFGLALGLGNSEPYRNVVFRYAGLTLCPDDHSDQPIHLDEVPFLEATHDADRET